MIDPYIATAIIVVFLIVFGIFVPILNVKCSNYVSFRWICMVVVLCLLIGATIDFKELNDEARHIILYAGLIITGVYIILRTVEKMAYAQHGIRVSAKHGDSKVELQVAGEKDNAVLKSDIDNDWDGDVGRRASEEAADIHENAVHRVGDGIDGEHAGTPRKDVGEWLVRPHR